MKILSFEEHSLDFEVLNEMAKINKLKIGSKYKINATDKELSLSNGLKKGDVVTIKKVIDFKDGTSSVKIIKDNGDEDSLMVNNKNTMFINEFNTFDPENIYNHVYIYGAKDGKITDDGSGVMIFDNIKQAKETFDELNPTTGSKKFTHAYDLNGRTGVIVFATWKKIRQNNNYED